MAIDTATEKATGEASCTGDLSWLLARASHALCTESTAALEAVGISPRGHHVLSAALGGEHTQIELARMIGLDKTTMVVLLDELEEQGLAERTPSPTDRRARVITVTAAGRRKVRQAEAIIQRVRDDVLSAIPAEDRDAFLRTLTLLAADRLSVPVQCSHPVRRRAPKP